MEVELRFIVSESYGAAVGAGAESLFDLLRADIQNCAIHAEEKAEGGHLSFVAALNQLRVFATRCEARSLACVPVVSQHNRSGADHHFGGSLSTT